MADEVGTMVRYTSWGHRLAYNLQHQCLTIDDGIAMMGTSELRELAKFATDAAAKLEEAQAMIYRHNTTQGE